MTKDNAFEWLEQAQFGQFWMKSFDLGQKRGLDLASWSFRLWQKYLKLTEHLMTSDFEFLTSFYQPKIDNKKKFWPVHYVFKQKVFSKIKISSSCIKKVKIIL